jgi:hypothetical protein
MYSSTCLGRSHAHHQEINNCSSSLWFLPLERGSRSAVGRGRTGPARPRPTQAVSKPVWYIPLLCVQWKTPDDGQKNCPKHMEFYSKIKTFEKWVNLVVSIIRNLSRCTAAWASNMFKRIFSFIIFTILEWKECDPFTRPCCCKWTNYEVK